MLSYRRGTVNDFIGSLNQVLAIINLTHSQRFLEESEIHVHLLFPTII